MDLISARAVPERSPLDEMLDALDDESQIDRLVELFVIRGTVDDAVAALPR